MVNYNAATKLKKKLIRLITIPTRVTCHHR